MILTDIHCHILPGVDDGAPDMMVTKDMLDKMYDEGVQIYFLIYSMSKYRD